MFHSVPDISFREISLDELPKYSPWPARLLGSDPFIASEKTPEEIQREFGMDKWGALLARARAVNTKLSMTTIAKWERGQDRDLLCAEGDRIGFVPDAEAQAHVIELIAEVLRGYYPADALVELGAGYGQKILSLAVQQPFLGKPLIAGEITQSGRELMTLIASAESLRVQSIDCDIGSAGITSSEIPPGAVVFTSYAAHYVPEVSEHTLLGIAKLRPKIVVHFEPVYEHHDQTSLLGLLRRRYIEANGYNRNLLSAIRQFASCGNAEVVDEIPSVFGLNALLPFSVISWRPLAA